MSDALPDCPPPPTSGAVRPVVQYPDPALRQVCVGLPDDPEALALDMLATMYAAPGRGLAAPQLGLPWRMFVMDVDWKSGSPAPLIALDPALSDPSAETVTRSEGCLSIADHPVLVTRPAEVTLHWTDLAGNRRSQRLTGVAATCAQHEYDHLDGILILDHERPEDAEA
ncbi:peptide deformylase [Paracoccus suum]|uniref:Peptide deformylase n=1 Tax=Paracoccus suum TaxID=2259340 RepID=A0A344PGI0_9RHOB|nr:peptide deformylase [Paracoccus suum]AXC48485.1 peptide deformylase [Paracoccus suum]